MPQPDHPFVHLRKRRVRQRVVHRPPRGLRRRAGDLRRLLAVAVVAAFAGLAAAPHLALHPAEAPETVVFGSGHADAKRPAWADTVLRPGRTAHAASVRAAGPGRTVGTGEASYYGDELRGRPTASGEAFDPEGHTAAHRTLPLGSRLRVTNLDNGLSVVVRVNDRGPFSGDRVLDVSEQAARDLGMLGRGTAHVRMELIIA